MESSKSPWKGCFVGDIRDNQSVEGVFLVKEITISETRAGKPFLTLTLMDKTGEITGRVWDNVDRFKEICQTGVLLSLVGQAQSYKGSLQLSVKTLQKYESNAELAEFLPSTQNNPRKMLAELRKYAESVEDLHLNELLRLFFNDKNFVQQFSNAPAAKNMHHAYIGGLLEHTLAIVRLAIRVAEIYPSLDRSLLLSSAIMHDIGKIKEFSFAVPPFDYSDQGRLVGHMVLAIEMINEKIIHIRDFPEELAARIKHLILSHHGRHEFGSPSLPMIREAFVLNFLDDLDAKINYMDRLSGQMEGDGYQWTPYQRTLERFLFVPGYTDETVPVEKGGDRPEEQADDSIRQPTLWEL